MPTKGEIIELLNKSKCFCLAPWIHLHITGLGVMSPCSMSEKGPEEFGYGSLNENTFDELWQGERIRQLRLRMLRGETDQSCVNCRENRLGHWSFRNEINLYDTHLEWVANTDENGYAPDAKPIFWDIRFSNICNLKCRSCGDTSSTSWYSDALSLGNLDSRNIGKKINGIEDKKKLIESLEKYLPNLEGIRFAGGEPLLMDENYFILSRLIELNKFDVRIEFETNLTILDYKNNDIVSLWKRFNNILISISMDGAGNKCEYLRKGSDWNILVNNLLRVKNECTNADIRINYTVTAYNIDHLPDFHRSMVENCYISPEEIQIICAYDPKYFSSKVLPHSYKKQITQKIKTHIQWLRKQYPYNDSLLFRNYANTFSQWIACIEHMNHDDWTHLIPTFLYYSNRLDELRQEHCLSVFPELLPIYNEYAP